MIVAVDNGQDYSDHTIYFVEIRDELVADFERVCVALCRPVLFTSEKVEWRDVADAVCHVWDVFSPWDFNEGSWHPTPSLDLLTDALLDELVGGEGSRWSNAEVAGIKARRDAAR